MGIRAIFFDIGDTLWHAAAAPPAAEFRRLAAERAGPALLRLGVDGVDAALAARTAWDALDEAMRRARASDLREPDYAAVCRDALVAVGVVLSRDAAAAFLDAIYVSGLEGGKAPYVDAVEVLQALRGRGFLLGTLTNRAFGGERFRADLRAAGLDIGWDAHAVSVEVGYLKPHPAIFESALAAARVRAGEALMVGNSLAEDVAGAQRVGMLAAWRRSRPDAEGVVPDFTFDELSELLAWPPLEGAR
jgi:putative hydrolase of the HAD superfamily